MSTSRLCCAYCRESYTPWLATYDMGDHDITLCDPCYRDHIAMCVAINREMAETFGPDWHKP